MKVLVTGGAGLVGNTMCRELLSRKAKVLCVDNLSLGTQRHIEEFKNNGDFKFEKWDVSQKDWHAKLRGESFDLLVHLAANSDISLGHKQPEMDYTRTFVTTFEALQAARDLKIPNFIFSSSSAVYGANPPFPTPEGAASMHPVSIYGAGKLASENYISAFVENYGLNAWVYRFGNVVGQRLTHGVIYDFVRKLKANPHELEVLGNGMQNKTYIDVEDCVSGILHAFDKSKPGKNHAEKFQVFNLSSEGTTSVKQIAEETVRVVSHALGKKTHIKYGSSSIGWVGDVPKTKLAVDKIFKLGWRPKLDSDAAVFQSIQKYYEW
jgi:UDP-glucose 4-epimerase